LKNRILREIKQLFTKEAKAVQKPMLLKHFIIKTYIKVNITGKSL